MKNIVIFDEFNEIDLKPSDLLHKYIQLTERDAASLLAKDPSLKECACPGCRGKDVRTAFLRFGLRYVECTRCRTLFVSPRPDDDVLEHYYRHSAARTFWREELSKMTRNKRREKIIKPRFEWISDTTREYLPGGSNLVDINTDQYGYIEAMAETKLFRKKSLFNPYLPLDDKTLQGQIDIARGPFKEALLDGTADVVTAFEVADRTSDIETLFEKIHRLLKEDGLCFMTDILISGFDLQTLWDKAENIFPPDRLNVFSVEGFKALFDRHRFECLEFSTPGILDVEIVKKAMELGPHLQVPRFTEYLLRNRDVATRQNFQEFLQQNLLSSYGRIVLRKK